MNATQAGEAFAKASADLDMTVLHDDGLYRHVRFSPRESVFTWFELVTWPGTLAIRGSHGGHLFARERDMFGFFRASRGINADYWAEKLPAGRDSVRVYDEDHFVQLVEEHLGDYEQRYPALQAQDEHAQAAYDEAPIHERYPYKADPKAPAALTPPDEVRAELAEAHDAGDTDFEDGARELLRRWETAGVFRDTFEWQLRTYDYHYLWCCHAIRWGIAQYDAAAQAACVGSGHPRLEAPVDGKSERRCPTCGWLTARDLAWAPEASLEADPDEKTARRVVTVSTGGLL